MDTRYIYNRGDQTFFPDKPERVGGIKLGKPIFWLLVVIVMVIVMTLAVIYFDYFYPGRISEDETD